MAKQALERRQAALATAEIQLELSRRHAEGQGGIGKAATLPYPGVLASLKSREPARNN